MRSAVAKAREGTRVEPGSCNTYFVRLQEVAKAREGTRVEPGGKEAGIARRVAVAKAREETRAFRVFLASAVYHRAYRSGS